MCWGVYKRVLGVFVFRVGVKGLRVCQSLGDRYEAWGCLSTAVCVCVWGGGNRVMLLPECAVCVVPVPSTPSILST